MSDTIQGPFKKPGAARYLGISYRSFRTLDSRGLVKPIHGTDGPNQQKLYTQEELDRFLKGE